MKKLGWLNTISLHLFQDEQGDLYVSRESEYTDHDAGVYIAFPASGSKHDLDAVVAEIRQLTEDPTTRLVAAVRAAVAEYQNEDTIELDLDPLTEALEEFDQAVAERQ